LYSTALGHFGKEGIIKNQHRIRTTTSDIRAR
jgi:hypothetical protein